MACYSLRSFLLASVQCQLYFKQWWTLFCCAFKWQSCLACSHNVVVNSDACEQHIQCLQPVLQAIRTAWLSLKSKKCHFGYGELNILGHTVSNASIWPDTKRTTAVATFQTPTNKAFVRQFLKLCAWPPRLHPLAAFALPVPFGTLASKKKKSVMWRARPSAQRWHR